jgi:hypothetical protein
MDSAVKIPTVMIVSISACSVSELEHEGHIYVYSAYVMSF